MSLATIRIHRLIPDAAQELAESMAVLLTVPFDPVYATAWLSAGAFFLSRWRRFLGYWNSNPLLPSTLGLLLLVFHIAVSYHWAHDWSQRQAAEHVAARTEEMVGIRSSLGLYANFGVVIVWSLQLILLSLRSKKEMGRERRIAILLAELFLWFMFLNAAVVFAIWPSRVAFLVLALLLGWDNWTHRTLGQSSPIHR